MSEAPKKTIVTKTRAKPCPFCRHAGDSEKPLQFIARDILSGVVSLACPMCGSMGPATSHHETAVVLWNRRPR